ncbi:MAG TPA: ZIP family metal transporter [Acidobacteriota bacterium]|jgi:zinc transporter ZupT
MNDLIVQTLIAAILTDLATGLGALPFVFVRNPSSQWQGRFAALAGGMMLSASVFGLSGEALKRGSPLELAVGIVAGAAFLSFTARTLQGHHWKISGLSAEASRKGILVFVAMAIHSFPEGVAIGVSYATGELGFGLLITLAIAVHNIPEGMAIALPLRAQGVSVSRCAYYAVLSSFPQPLAAVPAVIAVSFFQPLLPAGLGFAAGAMIFLVFAELLPETLDDGSCGPRQAAWWVTAGIVIMLVLAVRSS